MQRLLVAAIVVPLGLWAGCRRNTGVWVDYIDHIPGYDVAALDGAMRETFTKILHSEICPCGHRHHVARCVTSNNPRCEDAHRIARFTLRRLRAGDSMTRVVLMLDRMFAQGEKPATIPIDGTPIQGEAAAPVTLVEFSDFECPFCRKALDPLKQALKAFAGKVRLGFKHLPLVRAHPNAMLAAQAAVAAQNQGKFWEMHDLLFENQRSLSRTTILGFAKRLSLDEARFTADLDDPKTRARIDGDVKLAEKLGVRGTPSFFVNGRRLLGAKRLENYRDYIEMELDRSPAAR